MLFSAIRYLTDFADQAVILPLIAGVGLLLWTSGWRRGAIVWCLGTGATLGLMLVLKLGFRACGPELFGTSSVQSPSGHTAAAGVVYGTILGFINTRLGGRQAARVLIVLAVVVLIGASRVLLGAHTPAEAMIGGAIGILAAQAILHVAGEPTGRRSVTLSLLPILVLPLLLHGLHVPAEEQIRLHAFGMWPFSLCR